MAWESKRCYKCGKNLFNWHYVNNKPVCVDDRLCYQRPKKKYQKHKSKKQVLARVKAKYGGDE